MEDPDYYTVGPGFYGFVATFVMALAIFVIYRSLSRHLRKIRRDAERAEEEASLRRNAVLEDGDGGGDVVTGEPGDGE